MRKLKYILASVVLAAGFASCETEPIDETLNDDTLTGKTLFSFNLNGKQTVTSDDVSVGFPNGGMTITAKLSLVNEEDTSNPETRYRPAYLYINYNSLVVGNFPTQLSVENPSNLVCDARLLIQEYVADDEGVMQKVWVEYLTDNADENQNAGYSNITRVNSNAKYLNGNFELILFPEEGTPFDPQRLTTGSFNYLRYE
ncbi:hypothetical protein MG290_14230 [Flavobacterium sp. CBA20B-1]|uniref:hypothetical protein n=1 Tax=unclassified Flavobacterium TaxID=196869 RepID=UPI002224B287|nr:MULTISPECIES: hypothetical protein [unclassified Flavobacterium]WCM42070.1 hypothetical protein MG290_14230 [Flavobacterium sp. CBA20B-1]